MGKKIKEEGRGKKRGISYKKGKKSLLFSLFNALMTAKKEATKLGENI